MRLCLVVKERGSEKGGGGEFFRLSLPPPTPPPPPCSHCLTLTSQYDTDAICLSPPDITTVLPAAGAWGLRH